jgi:peptidoglycan/xylan/chitin deacetylase (PgdA/CDA1 family)
MTTATNSGSASFAWPRNARAAISLTYDDALPSQRQNAARQLAAYQLHGTFFLTGTSEDLAAHRSDWQAILSAGHEFASHTMHHPCDRSFDWVKKGFAIQDYDLGRMQAELQESISMLQGFGAQPPYTFSYPCGTTQVGEARQSYAGLVSNLFLAARGIEARVANPHRERLDLVPACDGAKPKEALVALVDRAVTEGGWLVLLFHGVGGDYISVSLDAHEALLNYLGQRRDTIWTETFGAVAAHVRAQRQ